jgi:hypothetical protein
MTTLFNEGRHPGEFLLSEAEGTRSREVATVAAGAGIIAPGTVLGRVTASGKFVASPDTGADGSQTAACIALYGCDATSADQKITVIQRDAEVKADALVFAASVNDAPKRAAKATQLAALGIIVRS